MIRGLRITGQSIDIEKLRPFVIAFSERFASKFGTSSSGHERRLSKSALVDMICHAGDDADEMLRIDAMSNGMDDRIVREGQKCPSHPHMDPDQKETRTWQVRTVREARRQESQEL